MVGGVNATTPRLYDSVAILEEACWATGPLDGRGKSRPHMDLIPGLSSPWFLYYSHFKYRVC